MTWLSYLILATYAAQMIQVVFFPVPSAGSTWEMIFKTKDGQGISDNHPAKAAKRSRKKLAAMIAATLLVVIALLIPALAALRPSITTYLLPWFDSRPEGFGMAAAVLLVFGNVLTFSAVISLRKHVTFHPFGEAATLYTAGIFGRIRNPISVGLAAVFAAFLLAFPSWVMLAGFVIFALNTHFRVHMEEVYLRKTFAEPYMHYQQRVGKYLPKLRSLKTRERSLEKETKALSRS